MSQEIHGVENMVMTTGLWNFHPLSVEDSDPVGDTAGFSFEPLLLDLLPLSSFPALSYGLSQSPHVFLIHIYFQSELIPKAINATHQLTTPKFKSPGPSIPLVRLWLIL